MSLINIIHNWIDERIDLKTLQAKMLNEPMPGGSSYAYAFGSALLFIFIMQATTGIFLMFYYAPTADHAWQSTQYILKELDYGWFILSFHFWGASAMVVMLVSHMLQVFIWGAYKKPREMVWLAGIVLFLIVMGFGFTGYLLPWDQRAFWGTTVGVEIMDKAPIVGDFLARFLRGGPTAGAQTLSRFFVIHVMILPAALVIMFSLHLFFFRKAGPAGPFKATAKELETKMEFFFPRQVFKDIVVMAGVFVVIAGLSVLSPVELLDEASPEPTDYNPEPEWYFLFLFQLLRLPMFSGQLGEFLGAIALPGLFIVLLMALPFINRNPERHPLKRPFAMSAVVLLMVSIVVLTWLAIASRSE
ncbi:MAG: cytochrome bc complex cytochrome b subunit [Nitrospirae bacterium]|nr:cytochrome bc complex cytochrome b subunit [Nitrospirota bacterium]